MSPSAKLTLYALCLLGVSPLLIWGVSFVTLGASLALIVALGLIFALVRGRTLDITPTSR